MLIQNIASATAFVIVDSTVGYSVAWFDVLTYNCMASVYGLMKHILS